MLVFNDIPITKPADFYAHFDMSQAVEQESELLRFAERNLAYASLLDLFCCTVLRRVSEERLSYDGFSFSQSFWRIAECVHDAPLLENQMLFDELFRAFFKKGGENWFESYLKTTAILLLGKQDISQYISRLYQSDTPKPQKKAESSDAPDTPPPPCTEETTKTRTFDELPSDSCSTLVAGRRYTYFLDPDRKPEGNERIRTVELQAPNELYVTLTFVLPDGSETVHNIKRRSSIFVNAIGGTAVSILKNECSFKNIRLCREQGGIYAYLGNERLSPSPVLPPSVSSFAVLGKDAYVYIENEELDHTDNVTSIDPDWYEYADGFSEVAIDKNGMPVVLDDRGRVHSHSVKHKGRIASLSKLINEGKYEVRYGECCFKQNDP